ncbi:MAG: ERCC4 domain-containing protein [Candidatus Bathyarchaeota archaeon]
MVDQTTILTYLPSRSGEKPRICVDSREAANKNGKRIVKLLCELGAETVVKKLDFGDYLIGEDVAVERKTVFDLANTLTQRFLFDQIFRMKEAYPRSIVLIEGYMGLLRKFSRISPESLSGALFALAQTNIPLIPTIDCRDTAIFLMTSAKQLLKNEKPILVIRHRIKNDRVGEQELFAVVGLPRIGPVLGKNLLEHFKTVRAVFSSSREEFMNVKGIGPQIAEGVMKVLDTPYKDDAENTAEGV